jgi:circadian clock protein KaiC
MTRSVPTYGVARRQISVQKLRGVQFREGLHDMFMQRGGLTVFPRLVAAEHPGRFKEEQLSSGLTECDALLGGGIDRGTSTMFLGPPGSGKSTLCQRFAFTALDRGESALYFSFDETLGTLLTRARALGMDFAPHLRSGRLRLQQVDPAELTPGELAARIRRGVTHDGVRVVVIDSINGFFNAMPDERHLVLHLHELLSFLNQQGVLTLMVLAQHGFLGEMHSRVDLSYLSDTVLVTRYFEDHGTVRKALSVMKRRAGAHENTIRELKIRSGNVSVGPPLTGFSGILTGIPVRVPDGNGGQFDPSP